MAKWLEARASLSMPVSGDFATTANFALVVSGVPTSGENTNASGGLGAERVDPGGRQPVHQPRAETGAAEVGAQHRLGQLEHRGAAVVQLDHEGSTEVAAGGTGLTPPRPPRGTPPCLRR